MPIEGAEAAAWFQGLPPLVVENPVYESDGMEVLPPERRPFLRALARRVNRRD